MELRKREHFPRKLIFKWLTLESTAGHLLVCHVTNGQDAVVVDVAPAGVEVSDVSTSGGGVQEDIVARQLAATTAGKTQLLHKQNNSQSGLNVIIPCGKRLKSLGTRT